MQPIMRATDPSVAEAQSWRRLPARTPQRSMKSGTRGSRRSGTVFGGTAHGLRCALSLGAALRAHALIQPACSLRFSFSGTQPRAVAPKLALRVRSGLGAHGQVDAAGVKSGPGQVQNTVLNEVGAVEGAHTPVPLAGSTAAIALVSSFCTHFTQLASNPFNHTAVIQFGRARPRSMLRPDICRAEALFDSDFPHCSHCSCLRRN